MSWRVVGTMLWCSFSSVFWCFAFGRLNCSPSIVLTEPTPLSHHPARAVPEHADKLATRCNKQDVALWLWAKSQRAAAAGRLDSAVSSSATGQGSPATPGQPQPWSGGVSPAIGACPPSPCPPPSPWGAGAGEGWFVPGGAAGSSSLQQQQQKQQKPTASPSPRRSLNGTPPRQPVAGTPTPPPDQVPRVAAAAGGAGGGFSPSHAGLGGGGGGASGGADDMPALMSSGWRSLSPAGALGAAERGGDEGAAAGEEPADNQLWRLGIPPPGGGGGGGDGAGLGDVAMEDEEVGGGGHGSADAEGEDSAAEEGEADGGKGRSTEQLLQDAFANLR